MIENKLTVKGMSCSHCENAVTTELTELGVSKVTASHKNDTVIVDFDPTKLTIERIKEEIIDLGYEVV